MVIVLRLLVIDVAHTVPFTGSTTPGGTPPDIWRTPEIVAVPGEDVHPELGASPTSTAIDRERMPGRTFP